MTNRFSRGEAAAFLGMLFCGCLAFLLIGVYAGRRSVETAAVPVKASTSAPIPPVPQELGFYQDMLSTDGAAAQTPAGPTGGGAAGPEAASTDPQAARTPLDSGVSPSAPMPAPTGPPRVFWTVQVGALDTADEAKQVIIRLEARGYSARLVEPREGAKDFFRVWVGEFEDGPSARDFEEKLKADGFHTYPKKVEEPNRSN